MAALAFASGLGFGAVFSEALLNTGLPFYALDHAEAVDGDTLQITLTVHVDGIDAAEIGRNRCPTEELMAQRAKDRAAELLREKPLRVKLLGEDDLGRMRAVIAAGGRSLKGMLLREGLVEEGMGRWCPDDAQDTDPRNRVQGMLALQP